MGKKNEADCQKRRSRPVINRAKKRGASLNMLPKKKKPRWNTAVLPCVIPDKTESTSGKKNAPRTKMVDRAIMWRISTTRVFLKGKAKKRFLVGTFRELTQNTGLFFLTWTWALMVLINIGTEEQETSCFDFNLSEFAHLIQSLIKKQKTKLQEQKHKAHTM